MIDIPLCFLLSAFCFLTYAVNGPASEAGAVEVDQRVMRLFRENNGFIGHKKLRILRCVKKDRRGNEVGGLELEVSQAYQGILNYKVVYTRF